MKFFLKVTLISVLSICFSCEKAETKTIGNIDSNVISTTETLNKKAASFDVYIKLVDRNGKSIPADTLPGYTATNLETGESYSTTRYVGDFIENVLEGSYRFVARSGYFDGASSANFDINAENVTSEGWIEVTLNYWSE